MQRRQETNQPRNSKQRSQHHACSNTNPEGEKEICIQPENSIPQGNKPQTVGFRNRTSNNGATVLNNVLYHYEVHLCQVSGIPLGTALLKGSCDS